MQDPRRRLEHWLTAAPADVLHSFWDLETDVVGQSAPDRLAILAAAVAIGDFALDTDSERAAWKILRGQPKGLLEDPEVAFLAYAGFAAGRTTASPTSTRLTATLTAITWLDGRPLSQPQGRLSQATWARTLERFGDLLVNLGESEAWEKLARVDGFPAAARQRQAFRRALLGGDVKGAVTLAADAAGTGDGGPKELVDALLARDYRLMKGARGPDAGLEARLALWLVKTLYPVSGTSQRSLSGPNHLLAQMGQGSLPADDAAFLSACCRLELATKNATTLEQLVDDRRLEGDLATVGPIEMRLLILAAGAAQAAIAGAEDVARWFRHNYRETSLRVSRGATDNVLWTPEGQDGKLEAKATAGQDINASQWVRALRFSSAAVRAMTEIGVYRVRSKFQRSAEARAELRSDFVDAIKDIVGTISDLRGGIQKVAQLGFVVQESLPYELRDDIAHALADGRAMAPETLTALLTRAYGAHASPFSRLSPSPLASGSIGQVHKGQLVSGEDVAVKVRYPGVEAATKADFKTMRALSGLARAALPGVPVKELLSNWERATLAECDFRAEAARHRLVSDMLAGMPVDVPRIHAEHCRDDIIVMEWIDGDALNDYADSAPQTQLNRVGIDLWRSQYRLLRQGLLRSDIQPSNYRVRDGRLTLLDLGFFPGADVLGKFVESHLERMQAIMRGDAATLRDLMDRDGCFASGDGKEIAALSIEVLGRPFRGRFRFTHGYAQEVFRFTTSPESRQVRIPLGHEYMVRIFWSLYSLLALLRAEADWRDVLEDEFAAGRRAA